MPATDRRPANCICPSETFLLSWDTEIFSGAVELITGELESVTSTVFLGGVLLLAGAESSQCPGTSGTPSDDYDPGGVGAVDEAAALTARADDACTDALGAMESWRVPACQVRTTALPESEAILLVVHQPQSRCDTHVPLASWLASTCA